jgi:8-oxo-dGTP pyrophosphatase MutT (NUDIX family)
MRRRGSVKADLLTEDVAKRGDDAAAPATQRQSDAASLASCRPARMKTPRVLVGKRGKGTCVHARSCMSFPAAGATRADNKTRAGTSHFMARSRTQLLHADHCAALATSAARGLAVAAAREMMEEAHLSLTPAK